MASTTLYRAASTATGATKYTLSMWIKRSNISVEQTLIGVVSGTTIELIKFGSNNLLYWYNRDAAGNAAENSTTQVFRDVGAFYNLVFAYDSTQASAADQKKIYINGVATTWGSASAIQSNAVPGMNLSGATRYIGREGSGTDYYYDGLMSYVSFVDGTAYDQSYFGETDSSSGIWKIKTSPSVTYGNNGFFLKMDTSSPGTDTSGNNNTFTASGTPTLTQDNASNVFTTLNGIHVGGGNSTLSNGNTTYSLSNYSYNTRSTLGMPSGKFYWEQNQSGTNTRIGLITSGFTIDLDTDNANAYYGGSGGGGVYLLMSNTTTSWQYTNNDTSQNTGTYTTAIASGANDILMGAVDVDAGKLWIGVNGVWFNSGNPATGSNATLTFTNNSGDDLQIFAGYGTSSARVSSFNFGNGFFGTTAVTSSNADAAGHGLMEYAVPTGFYTLNTKNLNTYG